MSLHKNAVLPNSDNNTLNLFAHCSLENATFFQTFALQFACRRKMIGMLVCYNIISCNAQNYCITVVFVYYCITVIFKNHYSFLSFSLCFSLSLCLSVCLSLTPFIAYLLVFRITEY